MFVLLLFGRPFPPPSLSPSHPLSSASFCCCRCCFTWLSGPSPPPLPPPLLLQVLFYVAEWSFPPPSLPPTLSLLPLFLMLQLLTLLSGPSPLPPSLLLLQVLFYVAEHRVYLLHKSLGDWLLQQYGVQVGQGHLSLGTHLYNSYCQRQEEARTAGAGGGGGGQDGAGGGRARPSSYMLKYLVLHLAAHPGCVQALMQVGGTPPDGTPGGGAGTHAGVCIYVCLQPLSNP